MISGTAFWLSSAAVLAVVLAGSFGGFLERPYETVDDSTWHYGLALTSLEPTLFDRLAACFDDTAGLTAYYSPVRACVWVLQYEIAGPRHWMTAVIATSLAMHLASALLVMSMLIRFGLGRAPAFLSGLLYVMHPVSDVALSGANGGINVIAMFFLLAALATWQRTLPGAPLRPALLAASALLGFASMNSNPVFLATAPASLLLLAVVDQLRVRRPAGAWIRGLAIRYAPHALAFGLSAWIRVTQYGHLGGGDLADFLPASTGVLGGLRILFDQFVAMRGGAELQPQLPLCRDLPPEAGPDGVDWMLAALAVAVATGAAAWIARTPQAAPGASTRSRVWPALLFAAGLAAVNLGAYSLLRSTTGYHRYLTVGLAGLCPIAAAAIWGIACAIGRAAGANARAVAAAILAGAVALAFARVNVESVASVAYTHGLSATVARATARVMAENPSIRRIVVVNVPASVRRAGLSFTSDLALSHATFNEYQLLTGRVVTHAWHVAKLAPAVEHEHQLFATWDAEVADEARRRETVVLRLDDLGKRIERLDRVENHLSPGKPGPFEFGPRRERGYEERPGSFTAMLDADRTGAFVPPLDAGTRGLGAMRDLIAGDPRAAEKLPARAAAVGTLTLRMTLESVGSPVAVVRKSAIEALGKLLDVGGADGARRLLASPHPLVARAGVVVADELDDAAAAELLREASRRKETEVPALARLAWRGDAAAVARLRELLGRALPEKRGGIAVHLAASGDPLDVARAGAIALEGRFPKALRQEAARAFARAGHAQAPDLVRRMVAADPGDSHFVWSIADVAAARPPEEASGLLLASFALARHPADVQFVRETWKRKLPETTIDEAARRAAAAASDAGADGEASSQPSSPASVAVAIERSPVWNAFDPPGADGGFLASVTNEGTSALRGGPGPRAALLETSWWRFPDGGGEPARVAGGEARHPLPASGIAAGASAHVPVGVRLPDAPGLYVLRCTIVVPDARGNAAPADVRPKGPPCLVGVSP